LGGMTTRDLLRYSHATNWCLSTETIAGT
jgi:hypothetical protein